MLGIDVLVPLVIQGGISAAFILMWWFERQDKLHEREQRDAERREYLGELAKRNDRLNDLAERGINNAHAMTVAITAIKDLILQIGQKK